MRYESHQFGSFDGRDNRRQVMELFARLGNSVPDQVARLRRRKFLQSLCGDSRDFSGKPFQVDPCETVQAYHLFVAITGCLGVPIEAAARRLEDFVRECEQR